MSCWYNRQTSCGSMVWKQIALSQCKNTLRQTQFPRINVSWEKAIVKAVVLEPPPSRCINWRYWSLDCVSVYFYIQFCQCSIRFIYKRKMVFQGSVLRYPLPVGISWYIRFPKRTRSTEFKRRPWTITYLWPITNILLSISCYFKNRR